MTDVDRLLQQYIEEHRSGGEADPLRYLVQVSDRVERLELEALIDGYLMHAPRQEVDLGRYEGSLAEKVVESLSPSITGVSGLWPTVLPELRNQARVKRRDLVARLATTLGVQEKEEKVADYYNQMEQGRLPAEGVSGRVLDALGSILGQSAERLRAMGEALGPAGPPAEEGAVFARMGAPAEQAAPAAGEAPSGPPDEWDDVDKLFRGGG
jgi:hypothetical protein